MRKALEGVRVLDLSHVWFGPFCTLLLAHMGAEVIKIEPPWGDRTRMFPPLHKRESPTFHALNLGKKGMTLNLKHPKGKEIFKELVKISDIVVENFTPGTMKKLGLDYYTLKKIKPDIIYASLSGFGQTGPYSPRPSFYSIAESISGHAYLTGRRVDPNGPPIGSPQAYGDLGPALFAAFSIVTALFYRERTGIGQWIDVAQADCMVALVAPAIANYTITGLTEEEREKKYPRMRGPGIGGFFKASDGWVTVLAGGGAFVDRINKLLGVKEVTKEMFQEWVSKRTVKEVVDTMVKLDVPVAPVLRIEQVVENEHLKARNMFVEVEHPTLGKIKVPNFPVKFSETPGRVWGPAPMLGQHNEEILTKLLHYTPEQIEALRKEGVIT